MCWYSTALVGICKVAVLGTCCSTLTTKPWILQSGLESLSLCTSEVIVSIILLNSSKTIIVIPLNMRLKS